MDIYIYIYISQDFYAALFLHQAVHAGSCRRLWLFSLIHNDTMALWWCTKNTFELLSWNCDLMTADDPWTWWKVSVTTADSCRPFSDTIVWALNLFHIISDSVYFHSLPAQLGPMLGRPSRKAEPPEMTLVPVKPLGKLKLHPQGLCLVSKSTFCTDIFKKPSDKMADCKWQQRMQCSPLAGGACHGTHCTRKSLVSILLVCQSACAGGKSQSSSTSS